MKAFVIDDQCEPGGILLDNLEFARFAAHRGFRIRTCRPYRARTKGKVERPSTTCAEAFSTIGSFSTTGSEPTCKLLDSAHQTPDCIEPQEKCPRCA
jgi:hypothetical protein